MVNYGKHVWEYVLEAAKDLNMKTFASKDIIKKVRERNPSVKAVTIRCHVIGMTPSHPSSKYYPSLSKNHPTFMYLGNGQFQFLGEPTVVHTNEAKETVEGPKMAEWEKLRRKIVDLQGDISPFHADFLDRDAFKKFCDNIQNELQVYSEICITGYFSETIRDELQRILKQTGRSVKLISPEFQIGTPRDRKNLEALKKLSEAGVEVRFNLRLHARFIAAYNRSPSEIHGILMVGSFDFNNECIGRERYDAGIRTSNPDLIQSAIAFFEQVWNDSETSTLGQFLKDKKLSP